MTTIDSLAQEERLRLFAAIQLPEEWLAALARIRANLETAAPGELRWVSPSLMHITVVFLGYQPSAIISTVEAALQEAARDASPFEISLGRLGRFGPPHAMTVLWAGLAGEPLGLRGLHRSACDHLSAHRIGFDQKPLAPHITLGRARKRPIDRTASLRLAAAIQQTPPPAGLSTTVERFVLMRSHLSPRGPAYQVLKEFPLGGGG